MRTADAARDPALSGRLLARLQGYRGPPVTVMEVCGTHTVAIARLGLRELLPAGVRLLSGPGCPVCVTPVEVFDAALHLAGRPGVTLASYGDALRVPGSETTLAQMRAEGADVRVVYSAADALALAGEDPGRQVVLFGLGFETTAPTVGAVLRRARAAGVGNFTVLSAHKVLLPAMEALAGDPQIRVGAFLCPGHASMVLGVKAYRALAEEYRVPCVVAGFEANDVLVGLLRLLEMVEAGAVGVENAYPRAVEEEGNAAARAVLAEVFEPADSRWRGLGALPRSGYQPTGAYAEFDARRRFLQGVRFAGREPPGCRCADVLKGLLAPEDCSLFGTVCTPQSPAGACMVSSEGACGAHYRYRRP